MCLFGSKQYQCCLIKKKGHFFVSHSDRIPIYLLKIKFERLEFPPVCLHMSKTLLPVESKQTLSEQNRHVLIIVCAIMSFVIDILLYVVPICTVD